MKLERPLTHADDEQLQTAMTRIAAGLARKAINLHQSIRP